MPPPIIAGTAQKTKIPNFRLTSIRVEPPSVDGRSGHRNLDYGIMRSDNDPELNKKKLIKNHRKPDCQRCKNSQYFQWD
jgi:hypothetical protein